MRADLHRIQSAPYPSSHARAKIRAEVEALAVQGQPVVGNVLEHDGAVVWPTQSVRSRVFAEQRALAFSELPNAVALIAWLCKDLLLNRLDAEVTAEADDKNARSVQAREQAAAAVRADLLAVERDESYFVHAAQAQGSAACEHRADCSPLALLNIQLVTRCCRVAAQPVDGGRRPAASDNQIVPAG